jgi:cytochrome c-type biogenesis protein CcmH
MAVVAAAVGALTPASHSAYRGAVELAPERPGVPFFIGVAQLLGNGLLDAASMWDEAARRTEEGSEERAEIDAHRERLVAVMRQIMAQQGVPVPQAPEE